MNTQPPKPSFFSRVGARAVAFVAAPGSPRPLATLRMGVSGVLLFQAFMIVPNLEDLFGPHGVIQWPVSDRWITAGAPRLRWYAEALAPFDVEPMTVVRGVFALYVVSLACLFAGWRTRLAAVLTWVLHLSFKMTGSAGAYGVDHFANIALFYMVWMPVGDCASLDRQAGRRPGGQSPAARLSLRVLQLHLCIAYFASGVEKATGADWWSGDVMWYSLMRPDLGVFDYSWLAHAEWVTVLIAWGTLILELGYPIYTWLPWTKKAWAWAVVGMHAGIGILMGLWTFSGIMIVLNVAAQLVPAEPTPATVETTPPTPAPAPSGAAVPAADVAQPS
jgi:hypothetical protein